MFLAKTTSGNVHKKELFGKTQTAKNTKIMLSKEITDLPFHIGQRIFSEGECGTVKFVGEIESQEGIWLGIEWDNALRGKHSGTYKNVAYFHASVPNSGSFIRPWKADTGISLPEAVVRRYGKNDEKDSSDSINLPQNKGHARLVEMVGFEKVARKQSQFEQLKEVVVSTIGVNSPGQPGELEDLVPNVMSLDLSCNLFVTWSQIAAVTSQLHQLKFLVLSKNRLKLENHMEQYSHAFQQLRTIILNYMAYSWNEIVTCSVMWPSIEELYACSNGISVLETPPPPILSKLRFLNLNNNSIRDWQEILKIGSLDILQELYLDECCLENIVFPDVPPSQKTSCFPSLRILSICKNNLSKWLDVAELNKLKELRTLRITNNPVLQSVSIETARQFVISKIPALQWLNRTEITKPERKGAEFDYIKRYYKDYVASGGQREFHSSQPSLEFLGEHPSFLALLEKHGVPEDSEIVSTAQILKNKLLSVQIFSSLCPSKPPVTKRLPATMPLSKVKGLVQRIFNVPAQKLVLMGLTANGDGQGFEMDNDMRQLSFYSLSDGDKIDVRW